MPPEDIDADLVVIGGGLAGLSAAVRAIQLGVRVDVLEQGTGERYPCNSRFSGGMFHLDYHDIALPEDDLARSLVKRAPDDVDAAIVELIARNAMRAVTWLRESGKARFFRVGPAPYEKWVLAPPRPPKPQLDWPGRGPDIVLRTLAEQLRATGMPVRTGHRVSAVAREDGGSYRLQVEAAGRVTEMVARAIVFADGGFQANLDLVRQSISPAPELVLQRNAGSGLGSSVSFAAGLGARLSELNSFYGHLVGRGALNNPELWPYPMIDGLAKASILVDAGGKRFVDEGRTGVYMANAVARRANPGDVFAVFDDTTWRSVGRETRVPPNPVLRNRGGEIFTASSIEALALQAGIAPLPLAETIGQFNAAVATRSGTALLPARTMAPSQRPIVDGPFHAVPVCAGITYTMGGMTIGPDAGVRANAGGTLPGLYAAGAAVGGVEGGAQSFYMGGLTKALVLGLVGAESAARYLSRTSSEQ